jgi:imipenem/basic amino acid-specific outer membrane pore
METAMRIATFSLTLSVLLCGTIYGASFDDAFKNGRAGGQIRLGAIAQENPEGSEDSYAAALGGQLKLETGAWNGLKFGVAAYISQEIGALSGDGEKLNPDFFADGGDSFAYVGEAYLDYAWNGLNLRVGRQQIDTPFADTDDIRMHPNTFEALVVTYSGFEETLLVGGCLTRWAGYDSEGDITAFKRFDDNTSSGAAVVGVVNESVEGVALQGWYYGIDDLADAFYTEAVYSGELFDTLQFEAGLQAAYFAEKEASGIDGSVGGVLLAAGSDAFMLLGAYNRAMNENGTAPMDGLGGGPYFTSMEEMTIDGLEDAEAYAFGAEADLSALGIDGLGLCLTYGVFKSDTASSDKAEEVDVILSYEAAEQFVAEVSYAAIDDKHETLDGDWSRWLARLNYSF